MEYVRETVGHVELRRYLDSQGMSEPQLAQLAGLSPMQLAHLQKGRRRASLAVAIALEFATRGAVKPRAWLESAA